MSIYAQDVSTYDSQVPNTYFDFSLKLVKETAGFSPPVAARAFGYMGLTLYEAMVPGMPEYQTTEGIMYELHDVTDITPNLDYHWPTVANHAMGLIIDSLFRTMTPANKLKLDSIRNLYNSTFLLTVPPDVYLDSKAFGEAIATDILDYSREDGGHNAFAENFPSGYIPPQGPDLWVPFGNQVCLQPYWGTHRPFIEADTSTETISPAPPPFSTDSGSVFYNYANQVYTTNLNLTPEQTNIALYWADGGGTITPAGHSISMLGNILSTTNANLEVATLAYAKLGIALSDAFLACWKTKFQYNLCRPVTYIRAHIDSTWTPLIGTPPFPEYPSGHSSQSGAMAAVMSDVFGHNYVFIDSTHGVSFGGPRTFGSFDEAAAEAAISRLYGGIHFEFGNMAGLTLGDIVGENVNDLFDQVTTATSYADQAVKLDVYPNPTSEVLHIAATQSMINMLFSITDIHGTVFTRGQLSEPITSVAMTDALPGMYILHLGDGRSTAKVFIQ
jgi:hypothetical protein